MSGTVYQAAAGALLQQMRLDLLSNNLANVNTVGYKADKPVFRVNTDQPMSNTMAPSTYLSPYAPPMEKRIDYSQGSLQQTSNHLDAAIVGNGFFEIQTPDGPRYTRKGSFSINTQGVLSTSEGWPVMGQGGDIQINGNRIDINEQGDVYVDDTLVDSLKIVDFAKPYDLEKRGDNLLAPAKPDIRQEPAEGYRIAQGFIESSNVDAIRTMTDIIETLRVFETYQRVMRSADAATAKTVSEVGKSV
jgi:flagellar basal-body rod protein FlgG